MNSYKIGNSKHQYVSGSVPLLSLKEDDTIYVYDGIKSYGGDVRKVHKSTSKFMALECDHVLIYLENNDNYSSNKVYVALVNKEYPNDILTKFCADTIHIAHDGYVGEGRIRNTIMDLF